MPPLIGPLPALSKEGEKAAEPVTSSPPALQSAIRNQQSAIVPPMGPLRSVRPFAFSHANHLRDSHLQAFLDKRAATAPLQNGKLGKIDLTRVCEVG